MPVKFILLPAALFCFISVSFCQAAESAAPASSGVGAPSEASAKGEKQSNPDQASDVAMQRSRMAAQMLDETTQARQAIVARSRNEARRHARRALDLANKLEDSSQVAGDGDLIPMYGELESASVLESAIAAQKQLAEPAPRGAGGQRPIVEVDATLAETHLEDAATALHKGDFKQADEDLEQVQRALFLEAPSDTLLLRAREDLSLARGHILDGDYRKAKGPLAAAADALGHYQENSSAPHRGQAKALQQEISTSALDVSQERMDTLLRIDDWCDELQAWSNAAEIGSAWQ